MALHYNGETAERRVHCPRNHGEWVLVLIQALLTEAGLVPAALEGLAFGCGPGSFTGLRIAAGVIQGIGLALEVPVAPVSTLAALALQGFERCPATWALPAIDARMGEVYWAAYQRDSEGLPILLTPEQVSPLDAVIVPERLDGGIKIGSGWGKPAAVSSRWQDFARDAIPDAECGAKEVATLGVAMLLKGKGVAPDQALPLYLRDRVTTPPSR